MEHYNPFRDVEGFQSRSTRDLQKNRDLYVKSQKKNYPIYSKYVSKFIHFYFTKDSYSCINIIRNFIYILFLIRKSYITTPLFRLTALNHPRPLNRLFTVSVFSSDTNSLSKIF